MGIPTSVSIGSMVNLPPTARSEDYVGDCNCKYPFREKPRNRYIFDRGAWGDACASGRGVVFLLYLAFIDCVKDSMPKAKPKNQNIFVSGVLGDVCASFGRGIPPAPCDHCDTSAPCAPCDTLLILCASDCALVSCAHYLTRAPATSRARARPTTDGRPSPAHAP